MWLIPAALMVGCEVAKNIALRYSRNKVQPLLLALITTVTVAILLIVPIFLTGDIVISDYRRFFLLLLLVGSANAVAGSLFIKTMHAEEISRNLPVMNLIPLFSLVPAHLLTGAAVSWADLLGVTLVVTGLFINNYSPGMAPQFSRGTLMMLAVAVIYAVTSSLDRLGIQAANPATWALTSQIAIAFFLSLFFSVGQLRGEKKGSRFTAGTALSITLISLVTAGSVFFQMKALGQAGVIEVITFKRLQVVLTTLLAITVLREENKLFRITGSVVTTAGAIITLLY